MDSFMYNSKGTIEQPYFLQRGRIQSTEGSISKAVRLDYMGSSEFEFGALPESLRRLQRDQSALQMVEFKSIVDRTGRPLLVYGNVHRTYEVWRGDGVFKGDISSYEADMLKVSQNLVRLKETARLSDQIKPEKAMVFPNRVKTKAQKAAYIENTNSYKPNFWWDIGNDFMMAFDADFMQKLPNIMITTWAVMDENKRKDQEEQAQSAGMAKPVGG
jgi:hypothetical protein